ncbi:MAG TPA: hypothetical protein VI357_00300 [Mycobacteriales bacterium]
MTAATARFRWCTLYADTPDQPAVVTTLAALLGPADALGVVRVQGFTVDVRRNPDRSGGDHHLDWSTAIEIDADDTVPDCSVITLVTSIIDRLHAAGLRVAPDCEFTPDLPPPDTR